MCINLVRFSVDKMSSSERLVYLHNILTITTQMWRIVETAGFWFGWCHVKKKRDDVGFCINTIISVYSQPPKCNNFKVISPNANCQYNDPRVHLLWNTFEICHLFQLWHPAGPCEMKMFEVFIILFWSTCLSAEVRMEKCNQNK